MERIYSPLDPVFQKLLELNPWASDLWSARHDLVAGNFWNVHQGTFGGNEKTKKWFGAFVEERSLATLSRFRSGLKPWEDWRRETESVLGDSLNLARLGSERIGSFSFSDEMPDYRRPSFLADLALFADVSVKTQHVNETLDISGLKFPAAFHAEGNKFEVDIVADEASFGPGSNFGMAEFRAKSSFNSVTFSDFTSFVGTHFFETADFRASRFGFESSFTACNFKKGLKLEDAVFEGSAPFCGAQFHGSSSFDRVHFLGRTEFGDADFHGDASFQDTWFPDVVAVSGVKSSIVDKIVAADHSKQRSIQ